MKNEILNFCDQLVAAAANGVYQGIIIAVIVALCLRWLVRTNAATRHAVWFCTLLLLVALFVAHCLVDSFSLRRMAGDAAPASNAEFEIPPADAAILSSPEVTTDDSSSLSDDCVRAEQHPLLVALIEAQHESDEDFADTEQPNGFPIASAQSNHPRVAGLASHTPDGMTDFRRLMARMLNPIPLELTIGSKFSTIATMLLALWLMIAGLRVLMLIVQLARIRKLKQESLPPGVELNELFKRLSARMVTNRKVQLKVSPEHRSSFLLGFLQPVVLLPADERMELAEAELVLRHELAHVERRDDWANLIQHFLLAIFFFHPAFWWVSRQLSLEREIACDDHVLQQSKRPQTYALVLANLAARMQKRLPLLAPGSSNNKTQLKKRIDMILNTHRNASPRLAKAWLTLITSTAALVAVAVICAAPRIVLAQNETTGAAVAASAPVPPVPPADVLAVTAVAGLPPLPPAAVSAAPKFKPSGSVTRSTSPTSMTPPTVTAPTTTRRSVPAARPGQPAVLAAIEPPSTPRPLPAPRPGKVARSENRDASLEERLDRLERMLESLMNQQNPKGRSDFQLKFEDGMIDRKEMARIEAFAKQQAEVARRINPQEIERVKEQAKREASRATEQAKRATAEVEKVRKANQKEAVRRLKEDSQRQLEALRRQVEALERQREKLDREIERLEEDQDNLDEQDDDSVDNDTALSESKEVCVTESSSHSHSHTAQ